jgi:hypothetical protein
LIHNKRIVRMELIMPFSRTCSIGVSSATNSDGDRFAVPWSLHQCGIKSLSSSTLAWAATEDLEKDELHPQQPLPSG